MRDPCEEENKSLSHVIPDKCIILRIRKERHEENNISTTAIPIFFSAPGTPCGATGEACVFCSIGGRYYILNAYR
jgi:hypothetical protein